MDEFRSIAELFAPLALPEGAGLLDDAAFISPRPGQELVVTADAVVEGVHFLAGTAPDLVARKLLRVNLSDLAAKGAEPFGYLLVVTWPAAWSTSARAAFARGLAEDQARFGIGLLGGDTVSTSGPMSASMTALGHAPLGRAVRRKGAQPGDLLLASGTIGDGWLGLQAARGLLALDAAHLGDLAARYHLPEPRLALGAILRAHAHAALDVSDGLIADVGHLARASGVRVVLALDQLPLSSGAQSWLARQPAPAAALEALASGGDDYELAFAIAPSSLEAVTAEARDLGLAVRPVGRIEPGEGVRVLHGGSPRTPRNSGWRHG